MRTPCLQNNPSLALQVFSNWSLHSLCSQCGFQTVMMSGSGTSIFCLGSATDSDKWSKVKSREDVEVFVTEFVNREEGEWYEMPRHLA